MNLDDIAVLGRLFVHPQARGLGIGKRLTAAATVYAQDLGRRVVLDVMQKDVAAIRTYEALGWRCLGSITHDFGDNQTEPALAFVSPQGANTLQS
jgi:ribosomal protein S18 acetylase RimI-like enzyme